MISVATRRHRAIVLVALVLISWTAALVAFAAPVSASPTGSYSWPVKGRIVLDFKKPAGPYGEGGHQGVDIAAQAGSTVKAAGDGTITWAGEVPRGRFISISHPDGVKTTYLDLRDIYVKNGDSVRKGQAIGTVQGDRDSSSAACHLHFSASLQGTPIDPVMLMEGIDSGSFIRLCPASGDPFYSSPGGLPDGNEGGIWSGMLEWMGDLGSDLWGLLEEGLGAIGNLAEGAWGFLTGIWNKYLFPALDSVGGAIADAAIWVWSNPYVQALTAGFLAAIAAVVTIVALAIALGISVIVTVVAAVVAVLACIGMAIYYAATSGGNVDFTHCFWLCFSAGITAGTFVLSFGSLGGALSNGFTKLGIAGIAKSALSNGLFSAIFEGASGYLVTGDISVRNTIVAFAIGAAAGAINAALKAGIAPQKIMEFIRISLTETRLIAWGTAMAASLQQSIRSVNVVIAIVRNIAVSATTKAAYILFSGSLGASINLLTCALTGREITMESVAASFITGAAMGAVSLAFGVQGIQGLLAKFKLFQAGIGQNLGKFLAKCIEKILSKSLKQILESGFKKFSRWKEV